MQLNRKLLGGLYIFVMACFLVAGNAQPAYGLVGGPRVPNKMIDGGSGSGHNPNPQPDPVPNPAVCGNDLKESSEECDGNDFGGLSCSTQGFNAGELVCSSSCTIEITQCTQDTNDNTGSGGSTGGGFGGGLPALTIYDEETLSVSVPATTVTWTTNTIATTRVVYDTESHDGSAGGPHYGYASFTPTNTMLGSSHSATITDLQEGATYFWRAVSVDINDKEAFGIEMSFTTPGQASGGETTENTEETTPTEEPTDETAAASDTDPSKSTSNGETATTTEPGLSDSQTSQTSAPTVAEVPAPRILGVSTVNAQEAPEEVATTTASTTAATTDSLSNGSMKYFTILLAILAVIVGRWLYTKYAQPSDSQSMPWTPLGPKDDSKPAETPVATETKKDEEIK